MIISDTICKLLVISLKVSTDSLWLSEIERSTLNLYNFACRNKSRSYRSCLGCIDTKDMVVDCAITLSL